MKFQLIMDIPTINTPPFTYEVLDRQRVKLIIESGDRSLLSASNAILEGTGEKWELEEDKDKLEIAFDVGKELRHKRLRVQSTVDDFSGANMTRIVYTLSGGSQAGDEPFDDEYSATRVIYNAEIRFI